jgi:hypothetical protein
VCSIRVVVNAAEECGGRVSADMPNEQVATTGVLVEEIGNVMDETGNNNKRTLNGLLLDYDKISKRQFLKVAVNKLTALPADDGQILARRCPVKVVLGLAKFLKLHRQLALLHFVLRENLQVTGESEDGANPDKPLRGIVLVPLDCVAIVHRELMMEVMVSLADSNQSSDEMVPGCVLVIERTLTKPVCK